MCMVQRIFGAKLKKKSLRYEKRKEINTVVPRVTGFNFGTISICSSVFPGIAS